MVKHWKHSSLSQDKIEIFTITTCISKVPSQRQMTQSSRGTERRGDIDEVLAAYKGNWKI